MNRWTYKTQCEMYSGRIVVELVLNETGKHLFWYKHIEIGNS